MTAGKRLRFIALLLALCLAVALPASAAGTASDSLITESWLDDWADELLAEAVSGIDGALEGAGQGGLTATEYVLSDGDRVSLGEGASVLLVSGAASMSVSGTVVNATAGAVASSGDVSARELYIVAGDSSASVVADGGARIAVWGSANVTERTLVFTDVAEGSWYYDYVYSAVAVGLIDGVTETTFEPESGFTVAQAIKIAACLHQYYYDGSVTLENDPEVWFKSYISYAVARLPVMLEWQRRTRRGDLYVAGGASIEMRWNDHSRYRTDAGKHTVTDDINLNPLGLNLELRAGYGFLMVYGRAALTPLLKTSFAPECYPVGFGIGFRF